MTIGDLLRLAQLIDPDMSYEVVDSTIYATGKTPERYTRVVQAFSGKRGAGSREDIEIVLQRDHVIAIIPGTTSLFWQVDPLMRAWRESEAVSMVADPTPR